jgi:hypothetical protein
MNDPVEWLWFGQDESGERHVSFGRWQTHKCQHRYKYAVPQATEHDHPPAGCILCANGNDLPEGEHCRTCGREGKASGLRAGIIRARGRQEPPTVPVAFDGEDYWTKAYRLATELRRHLAVQPAVPVTEGSEAARYYEEHAWKLHRRLNFIAKHPDTPHLIRQYAVGLLDGD